MEIPNIGKPGSTLAILIPGTFLLFNILIFIYFFIWVDNESISGIIGNLKEGGVALEFVILLFLACFGYLLGAILRLARCDITDKISGYVRAQASGKSAVLSQKFPYKRFLRSQCKREYPELKELYQRTWGVIEWNGRKIIRGKSFFNLCKIALLSIDANLAAECYAAEALNRYLSSMFYGLTFSSILIPAFLTN